ncbi:uncharacterized protein LOC111307089 [Durio zibethinus]|uniref:Uncharacterized protein LOC111307089 n=1 Tax=Durio zibethinus TaxID=66656 RepID=A0A6P6A7V0_DURZI|nr:uncharacterized protein LOC111307089 [Durio zibethinus]
MGFGPLFVRWYAFNVLNMHDPCALHWLFLLLDQCVEAYAGQCPEGILPIIVLFDDIYYLNNHSNSRANMCNKPQLLKKMHLLDKGSTLALLVALMIHDNLMNLMAFINWNEYNLNLLLRIHCRASLVPVVTSNRSLDTISLKNLEWSKIKVMINRDIKGILSTINDANQGSMDVTFRTLLALYEKSKSLGFEGSMVAMLKLKEINRRVPPRVEPAA